MNVPPALLTAFPASADLLLDVSRRQVDDGMLAEIAAADYGMDGDVHLAELRLIHDQGVIPAPLRWHPGEVLELIRWSNPEDPAHKPGCTGRRGHQMRAFACAALLRAAMGDGREVAEATLAQCLVSAKALGQEMSEAAARFLTWAIPRDAGCEQQWLLAFGLLVVAVRLRSGRIADRVLGDAADWVLAEEAAARRRFFNPTNPTPLAFGLLYGHWRPLADELIREAAEIHAEDVRDKLEFIGACVLEAA